MYQNKHAIFLGKNSEHNVTFFVAQQHVYVVGEISGDSAHTNAKIITEKIRSELLYSTVSSSKALANLVEKSVANQHNEKVEWAALALSEEVAYVATHGGSVLMHDKKALYSACYQNENKEGALKPETTFFLTTPAFTDQLTFVKEYLVHTDYPKTVTDALYEHIPTEHQGGAACIALSVTNEEELTTHIPTLEDIPHKHLPPIQPRYIKGLATLFILGLVLFFVARFVFGMIEAKRNASINQSIVSIGKLVDLLENNPTQDPQKLAQKIGDIQKQISLLTGKKLNPTQQASVQTLNSKIKDAKNTVGSVKMSKEELFFDMRLISKEASVSSMSIVNNIAVLLDKKRNKIYTLDLATKNKEEFTPKQGTSPLFASVAQTSVVYIDTKNGIYKETGGTFEKIVTKEDWGTVRTLTTFNSNLYVLDSSHDEIYKYTPVESGYSSKLSYFQPGSALDLARAKQIVIDFYVYLLTPDALYKFNGGVRENINVSDKINFADIRSVYTDSDSSYLYLLDSKNSRVIVLDKKGATVRSIFNPLLKDVDYFGIYKDDRLVLLHENKLYVLDNL